MKIAIISDTHDNLANFKKAISLINKEKIKAIIHCGDLCAPIVLKKALQKFNGKFYFVFGNVDGDYFRLTTLSFKESSKLKIFGEFGEITLSKKKIAFVHFPELAKGLAATQKYDLVFYGHTHKPWEEKVGRTKLINPGNLAGLFCPATFAIYDTKTNKLELKIL